MSYFHLAYFYHYPGYLTLKSGLVCLVVCVLRSLVLTVLMHSTSTKGKNALEYTILPVFCRTDAGWGGGGGGRALETSGFARVCDHTTGGTRRVQYNAIR
jgi:hypothetical protein